MASKFGSFLPLDRPSMLSVPARRSAVKPLNAEPKRNNSIVHAAATAFAPGNISIYLSFAFCLDSILWVFVILSLDLMLWLVC